MVLYRKKFLACLFGTLAGALYCAPATALDLGFDGLILLESSDNIEGVNSPDEQDGVIQSGLLGIYGEQRSRVVEAAFRGELDTRKVVADDDSDLDTITRFLGAAEFRLTPRSWRWYVGDILGGIRTDDGVQPIDDSDLVRRNVFVTGPSFSHEIIGISRTEARLLYVNQTQDDVDLETLYTANFSYERDAERGNYYGARLGYVFTDLPTAEDDVQTINGVQSATIEPDYNRTTVGFYYNRRLGLAELFGEIGATRYESEEDSLSGLNALLRGTRQLGPQTFFSAFLSRDLNDQTLSTVESLIASGNDAVGVAADAAGFFEETRVGVEYSYQSPFSSIDVGGGVAQLDYQLLSVLSTANQSADLEDRQQGFAYLTWSRRITNRLRSDIGVSYETQEYDNLPDNTDSTLLTAVLVYGLTSSFDLQVGVTHDTAVGSRTRFENGVGVEEDIDVTENRFTIGLRWQPPSRASQDLTVELKSLLR